MKPAVLFTFLSIYSLQVEGQGSPFIENFTSDDYEGNRQVWSITEDSAGVIYFGNIDGLRHYDGTQWQSRHISNNTIIRSLYTGSRGGIFYGAEGDFGQIRSDSLNRTGYRSFSDLLRDTIRAGIGNIFKIQELSSKIYFQAPEAIYVYDKQHSQIEVIRSEQRLSQLTKAGNTLFVRLVGRGLARIEDTELMFIPGSENFANERMVAAEQSFLGIIFSSWSSGITIYNNGSFSKPRQPYQQYLRKFSVYRSEQINEREVAFATLGGGIVVIDFSDHSYYVIDENQGLVNNVVYELYLDKEGILWAATDNGISKILINTPIREFDEQHGLRGNVFQLINGNRKIYALTTEGVFRNTFSSPKEFSKAEDIERPYQAKKFGEQIYLTGESGFYKLEMGDAKKVLDTSFSVFEIFEHNEEVLAALYDGEFISLFLMNSMELRLLVKREMNYTVDLIFYDGSYLWISDGQDRISVLSPKNLKQEHQYELPLPGNAHIRFIDKAEGRLTVGTDAGFYFFEKEENRFTKQAPSEAYNFFENKQVFRYQDCGREQWVTSNFSIYMLKENNVFKSPFQLIGDGEGVSSVLCKDEMVWFGGNAGIYWLKNKEWDYQTHFKTNVTGIYIRNDSLIYGGFGAPVSSIIFPYKDNEMRFTYAAGSYFSSLANSYQVKLEGFDEKWSNWTSETQKDYTNIPEGTYIFKVRSKNVFDVRGKEGNITFSILPPWYRTIWAYLFYGIIVAGLGYGGYKIRINQILKEYKIRNRIADDLHDEISATLTSISFFAEAANRTSEEKKDRFIHLIARSAADAKEKITDIVWAINPEHDEWSRFIAKCKRYASDLIESKNIQYEFETKNPPGGRMNMELRQNLWMMYKEVITNAVQHSGAGKINICFKFEGDGLTLIVQDNGTGFNPEISSKGNGIRTIQKRAGLIGALTELESNKTQGTRWIFKINDI